MWKEERKREKSREKLKKVAGKTGRNKSVWKKDERRSEKRKIE